MIYATLIDAYGIKELPGNTHPFDDRDREHVAEALNTYWSPGFGSEHPNIGDFILTDTRTGTLQRIASVLAGGRTQLVHRHGSFHMLSNGEVSFSGGLKTSDTRALRLLHYHTEPGAFWIFHHDIPGAGRGVRFLADRRVWKFEQPAMIAQAA